MDQLHLQNILRSGTSVYNGTSHHFLVRLAPWGGVDREIVVGLYPALDISDGRHLQQILPLVVNGRLDWKPYMVHLAWLIGMPAKIAFMDAAGYDFAIPAFARNRNPRANNWSHFTTTPFGSDFLWGKKWRSLR
jgi:hypothetical protein